MPEGLHHHCCTPPSSRGCVRRTVRCDSAPLRAQTTHPRGCCVCRYRRRGTGHLAQTSRSMDGRGVYYPGVCVCARARACGCSPGWVADTRAAPDVWRWLGRSCGWRGRESSHRLRGYPRCGVQRRSCCRCVRGCSVHVAVDGELWLGASRSVRRPSAAARVPVRVDLTWVVLLLCVVVVIRALLVHPRWVISLPPAGLSWRTRPCSCRA